MKSPQTDQTFNIHPFTGLTERSCLDSDSSGHFGHFIRTGQATSSDVNSVYRTESIVFWRSL